MRIIGLIVSATLVAGLLSGCSGNAVAPGASAPSFGGQNPLPLVQTREDMGRIQPDIVFHLYVADHASNRVSVYDHSLQYIYSITKDVKGPDFVTFDSAQNLYVANETNNTVTVYSPGLKTPKFPPISLLVNDPKAIAVDSKGFIYVANVGSNSVTIYDSSGAFKQQLTSAQKINHPNALAIDSAGHLYVANGATPNSPNGLVTIYSGSPGNVSWSRTISLNIDNPQALAFDKSGDVFVANDVPFPNGSVTEYRSFLLGNAYVTTIGLASLSSPNALAFDLAGHLCVSSPGNNVVICYNGVAVFKTITTDINNPASLAVGPVAGWLNVANDAGTGNIDQYCPTAACITPGGPPTTNKIGGPESIAFGP